MSKHDLIDAIRKQNQTATEKFLMAFDEQSLRQYLDRLALTGKRGTRASVWTRQCVARAVTRAA